MAKSSQEKLEFGKNLQKLLHDRNWSQADLVREIERATGCKMGRDAVSTYINGRSFPTPASLDKLCKAFNISPSELTPSRETIDANERSLVFEMRAIGNGQAWVHLNGTLSFATATQIAQLLPKD